MYCCGGIPLLIWAEFSKDPVTKGLEITQAWDKLDTGYKDSQSNLTMILRDRHGRESKRVIVNKTMEVEGDGDKTISEFNHPRTVKGTKFLSFTHTDRADDQWLYLPKLKRVKRITSDNKSGPFMSSEFAYEDISSQEVEKYTYKYVKDDKVGGVDCYVVERYPVDKKSGYSKQLTWIAKGDKQYRPMKVDYYDVKGTHLKTLTYYDYKQYLGQYWRPGKMEMINHVTGKSTVLLWENYKFANGFSDRDFDKNSLKR